MEAVLLGLTPAVRVADRQSPLAGALRRELAAVTGLAVTPLDLDPRDEGLFDALADALEECQVLVTIGDLEHPGGLRRLLTRGLGLETRHRSRCAGRCRGLVPGPPRGADCPRGAG